jgi:hypothetical protein
MRMQVGMLWLDTDETGDLEFRITRAAAHYRAKYGRTATMCLAHPSTLGKAPPRVVAGVKVRPNGKVLRRHLWLGVEETESDARS